MYARFSVLNKLTWQFLSQMLPLSSYATYSSAIGYEIVGSHWYLKGQDGTALYHGEFGTAQTALDTYVISDWTCLRFSPTSESFRKCSDNSIIHVCEKTLVPNDQVCIDFETHKDRILLDPEALFVRAQPDRALIDLSLSSFLFILAGGYNCCLSHRLQSILPRTQ